VSWCVSRLLKQGAHIVITNIPLESIEAISEWRYKMLRPALFPSCQLTRREVIERARSVYHGLVKMASSKNFELFEPSPDWFGADAIHVRYWKHKAFCQCISEYFFASSRTQCPVTSNAPWFLKWKQRPSFAYKKVMGWEWRTQQPGGQLADGTLVSMY